MKLRQIEVVLGLAVISGVMLFTLFLMAIAIVGIEGVDALIEILKGSRAF